MFYLPFIEYSKHIESHKTILLILGMTIASTAMSPKEKIEVLCGGKGTYFGLSLKRLVITSKGKTKVVPLLDYLGYLLFGSCIVVDRRKTDEQRQVVYDGRCYGILPIERRHTYSKANWLTSARRTLYFITDIQGRTTTLISTINKNPLDIARQAHLVFESRRT